MSQNTQLNETISKLGHDNYLKKMGCDNGCHIGTLPRPANKKVGFNSSGLGTLSKWIENKELYTCETLL